MTIKSVSLSIIIGSITLFSCTDSNSKKTSSQEEIVDSTSVVSDTLVNSEDEEVSYRLPSALQIAYIFKKSGSAFVPTLANNKANVHKYNSSNYKRATNFGVYSADLAYCLFNKKYQESKDYLKACKEMGTELGLNQVFESDNLAQRFDKNIMNEDSIVKIVSNVQLRTDVVFEQNKQKHITAIAFTGAWVESAYIASEVYAKDKNKKALASLLEQLLLSETIIKALKANQHAEPEMPALIEAVEKINAAYNSVATIKLANEKEEEIDFSKITVKDTELKAISEAIISLRKNIID
jgi:hypothetical protein